MVKFSKVIISGLAAAAAPVAGFLDENPVGKPAEEAGSEQESGSFQEVDCIGGCARKDSCNWILNYAWHNSVKRRKDKPPQSLAGTDITSKKDYKKDYCDRETKDDKDEKGRTFKWDGNAIVRSKTKREGQVNKEIGFDDLAEMKKVCCKVKK